MSMIDPGPIEAHPEVGSEFLVKIQGDSGVLPRLPFEQQPAASRPRDPFAGRSWLREVAGQNLAGAAGAAGAAA